MEILNPYLTEIAADGTKLSKNSRILGNSLDTPKTYPLQLPIRQEGDFSLKQVIDAQGEVWCSIGTGGWGVDILD